MDQFFHIRMLFSMVVSLSLAHLLRGLARIIEHPNRNRIYVVHLLWVLYVFALLVDFWWWEFKLRKVTEWTFASYGFIVLYIVIFYITCSLLFPDDLKEYDGYKGYYYSRRKWIFGLMALLFLADVGDTLIKGKTYYESLGTEYLVRIASHIVLFLLAARTRKEWYHTALVIVLLLYGGSWIARKYLTQ